jgi:hypothetical protein
MVGSDSQATSEVEMVTMMNMMALMTKMMMMMMMVMMMMMMINVSSFDISGWCVSTKRTGCRSAGRYLEVSQQM